jgi:phytanoyl-CoA hydroxylase
MKEVATTITTPVKGGKLDKGFDEMHAPELYHPAGKAHYIPTLDDLTPAEIEFYRENGYLAVQRAFDPTEVQAGLEGLQALIMGARPDFEGIVFESKAQEVLSTLNEQQRQDAVRKICHFVKFEQRLHALAYHPKLLAATRALIGEETHMFQDMGLIKPPRIGREKPWHQDHAYFNYPIGTRIVGVWVALDEATLENGCMQVLPGLHKEGPRLHFQRRDWQICDGEIMGRRSVAIPLKPGGVLFFDGLMPHGTPHNTSAKRRRAVQFHYVGRSVHLGTEEERLRVFGSEGKNVTC